MIMKKIFFLLAFALPLLTFTSCGTDDDPINDETEQGLNGDESDNEEGNGSVESAEIIEPVIAFGKDKNYIKQHEKRTLTDEEEDLLYYTDNANVEQIIYGFNPNLYTISMEIKNLTYEQVIKFYSGKYRLDEKVDGENITSFTDEGKTLMVSVFENKILNCVMVTYIPLKA